MFGVQVHGFGKGCVYLQLTICAQLVSVIYLRHKVIIHGQSVSQGNYANVYLSHRTELWHLHPALPSGEVFFLSLHVIMGRHYFILHECNYMEGVNLVDGVTVFTALKWTLQFWHTGANSRQTGPCGVTHTILFDNYSHHGVRVRDGEQHIVYPLKLGVLLSDVSGSIT